MPGTVGIAAEPFVAMVDIRLGAIGPETAARLGVGLPPVPNTWAPAGAGRAVWLGPDEWLLTSTTEVPEELEARVRAAGAAADVSAQRIALRLTGPRARDVLAKGWSIDLHPRIFRRGSSAQTTLGIAGIILLALCDVGDDYVVLVRSSFVGYLADWLLDTALEFTTPAPADRPLAGRSPAALTARPGSTGGGPPPGASRPR